MYAFIGTPLFNGSIEEATQLAKNNELFGKVTAQKCKPRPYGDTEGDVRELSKIYKTVGSSKGGWTPSAFRSLRSERHLISEQDVASFMDEEDYEVEIASQTKIKVRSKFAAGLLSNSKRRIWKDGNEESQSVSDLLASTFVKEFFPSSPDTIGKKLLKSMYWREGKQLGTKRLRKPPKHIALALKTIRMDQSKGTKRQIGPQLPKFMEEHRQMERKAASLSTAAAQEKDHSKGFQENADSIIPPLDITEYLKVMDKEENLLQAIADRNKEMEAAAERLLITKTDFLCIGCSPKQSLRAIVEEEAWKVNEGRYLDTKKKRSKHQPKRSEMFQTRPIIQRLNTDNCLQLERRFSASANASKTFLDTSQNLKIDSKEPLQSRQDRVRKLSDSPDNYEVFETTSFDLKGSEYYESVLSSASSNTSSSDNETAEVDQEKPTRIYDYLKSEVERGIDGRIPIKDYSIAKRPDPYLKWKDNLVIPEWFDGLFFPTEEDRNTGTKAMHQFQMHLSRLKAEGSAKLAAKHRSFLLGETELLGSNETFPAVTGDQSPLAAVDSRSNQVQWKDMDKGAKLKAFDELFSKGRNYVLGESQELEGNRAFDKPFAMDPAKQSRYEAYILNKNHVVSMSAAIAETKPKDVPLDTHNEQLEFERVYASFKKPDVAEEGKAFPILNDTAHVKAGDEEKSGFYMHGEERKLLYWKPSKLLCRRWNVPDPWALKEFRNESLTDGLYRSRAGVKWPTEPAELKDASHSIPRNIHQTPEAYAQQSMPAAELHEVSKRPPLGLFKAIFESEDEDE